MLIKNSEVGGVLSCSVSLSKGLIDKGDHVVIGTTNGQGVSFLAKNCPNLFIIDFNAKSIFSIIKNYKSLRQIIKNERIELIHCQNRIPAIYASFYCFFHRSVKYIWANHLVPISNSFFSRCMTHYGSAAVAEGVDGKDMLISQFHIPENKVEVINLGMDVQHFTPICDSEKTLLKKKLNIEPDDKVILLYGRLAEVKGHLFLLDSISKIKNKNYVLIFPGENEDYKNKILTKAESLGIIDKLRFPGYIDGKQYLSISDLMVLPSEREGFGIVNVESFCMGVPVIRTRTAGFKDMSDCCFGIEFGNVDDFSSLLQDFFDDNKKFIEKAIFAKNQVDRFSLNIMTDNYRKLYKRVIEEK